MQKVVSVRFIDEDQKAIGDNFCTYVEICAVCERHGVILHSRASAYSALVLKEVLRVWPLPLEKPRKAE